MATVFKELNVKEQEALFAIYSKYNGNISVMAKAKDCPYKNRTQLSFYRNSYNFKNKLFQNITDNTNKEIEITREKLMEAKNKAISKAINLLDIGYDYKQIKAAWEIIKVELGEPTNINFNNNTNDTENKKLDDLRSQINKLTTYVKTSTAEINASGEGNM